MEPIGRAGIIIIGECEISHGGVEANLDDTSRVAIPWKIVLTIIYFRNKQPLSLPPAAIVVDGEGSVVVAEHGIEFRCCGRQ